MPKIKETLRAIFFIKSTEYLKSEIRIPHSEIRIPKSEI
jgi:hypothetical protein